MVDAVAGADMYEAVVFDNDGVLVEPPSRDALVSATRSALEDVGLDADPRAVCRDLAEGDAESLADRCRREAVEFASFCQRAASAAFEAQRRELERGRRAVYDDVAALREFDAALGLVSDNHPQFVDYLLRRAGLGDLFETVRCRSMTPRHLDTCKPNPRNVRAALADLGTEDGLLVGDRTADVAAAERAGIDSALLERPDAGDDSVGTVPDADVDPDYRIESIAELRSVVG